MESPSAKMAACLINLGLPIKAAAEFSVAIRAKFVDLTATPDLLEYKANHVIIVLLILLLNIFWSQLPFFQSLSII